MWSGEMGRLVKVSANFGGYVRSLFGEKKGSAISQIGKALPVTEVVPKLSRCLTFNVINNLNGGAFYVPIFFTGKTHVEKIDPCVGNKISNFC